MKITKLVVISLKAISTLYFLLWWRSFELLSWWTVLTPLNIRSWNFTLRYVCEFKQNTAYIWAFIVVILTQTWKRGEIYVNFSVSWRSLMYHSCWIYVIMCEVESQTPTGIRWYEIFSFYVPHTLWTCEASRLYKTSLFSFTTAAAGCHCLSRLSRFLHCSGVS